MKTNLTKRERFLREKESALNAEYHKLKTFIGVLEELLSREREKLIEVEALVSAIRNGIYE